MKSGGLWLCARYPRGEAGGSKRLRKSQEVSLHLARGSFKIPKRNDCAADFHGNLAQARSVYVGKRMVLRAEDTEVSRSPSVVLP